VELLAGFGCLFVSGVFVCEDWYVLKLNSMLEVLLTTSSGDVEFFAGFHWVSLGFWIGFTSFGCLFLFGVFVLAGCFCLVCLFLGISMF
jgi:hypothetical protein